ncbi:MAG TPA: hypothetical protein VL971_10655, partial [Rhizomicrobium sp.]|nr:hypothetical protein [Rhizomicrobium sp.]
MFEFDHITQWASLAASIATVFALAGVWGQIRSARRLQERAAANSLYASFLQAAATNSDPLNVDPGQPVVPGSDRDWMIYFWLTAPESGWSAFEGDVTWNRRIESCARQNWRRIYPRDVDLPEADIERLEAIEAELDQIEADGEAADAPDTAMEERIAALNAEYEAIDAKGRVFEPEDVAGSGAILSVDQDGTLAIVRGLVRPEDEPKLEEASLASTTNAKETIEEDDEEKPSGLSDRLAVDLSAQRTMAMRDQLGVFPDMAHVVVTHALALQLFYYGRRNESSLSLLANSA